METKVRGNTVTEVLTESPSKIFSTVTAHTSGISVETQNPCNVLAFILTDFIFCETMSSDSDHAECANIQPFKLLKYMCYT